MNNLHGNQKKVLPWMVNKKNQKFTVNEALGTFTYREFLQGKSTLFFVKIPNNQYRRHVWSHLDAWAAAQRCQPGEKEEISTTNYFYTHYPPQIPPHCTLKFTMSTRNAKIWIAIATSKIHSKTLLENNNLSWRMTHTHTPTCEHTFLGRRKQSYKWLRSMLLACQQF